jgi:hypothetical protein
VPKPRSLSRRLLWAALVVAAVGQAVATVRRADEMLVRSAQRAELFAPGTVLGSNYAVIRAFRSVQALLPLIPEDGRVLLVNYDPFQSPWEFHFLPRPFRYLQKFDPRFVELGYRRSELYGETAQRYFNELERRGRRLTATRLRDDLAWAQWVVVVFEDGTFPTHRKNLEFIKTHEDATLYRLGGP